MMNVSIERIAPDQLSKQSWGFWLDDRKMHLKFNRYMISERASTRGKFRDVAGYTGTNTSGIRSMVIEDCPLPADVSAEALATFVNQITVGR